MYINTMLVGHVVTAEVIKQEGEIFHCRFLYHTRSGSKKLCLDFGQNWNVSTGYQFDTEQLQIDQAAGWMEKMQSDEFGGMELLNALKKNGISVIG